MFRRKSSAVPAPQPVLNAPRSVASGSQTSLHSEHSTAASNQDLTSDRSFWEIDQYKRVIKRMEVGIAACDVIQEMLKERAAVEQNYTKHLNNWADKWAKYFEKKPEFGTLGAGYQAMITEARQCANIHTTVNSNLIGLADTELPKYKKEAYTKEFLGYKEIKQAEKQFGKATKNYAKQHAQMKSAKKSFHSAMALKTKADIAAQTGLAGHHTTEEARKLEEKAQRASEDADKARFRYVEALQALNNDQPRYVQEMTVVYDSCQDIENRRIEKFREVVIKAADILDVNHIPGFQEMFATLHSDLDRISFEQDSQDYARLRGTQMPPNWPMFEEYDPAKEGLQAPPSHRGSLAPTHRDSVASAAAPAAASYGYNHMDQSFDQPGGGYAQDNYEDEYAAGGHGGRQVRALYSYDAQGDDELTFEEGAMITIIEEADASGWARGEYEGRVGMLPANYVE